MIKNYRYLERKNEQTIVSKVNHCLFKKSPQRPKIFPSIEDGLTVILNHFQDPIFPRTISTKATEGRQVLVDSKEQALEHFKIANYQDCRISAYPSNADKNPSAIARFQGIKKSTPSNLIVLIDLDKCNLKTDKALELALSRTLKEIKVSLGNNNINPTVLWSGNGYHIYLVLSSNNIVLEHQESFTNLTDQPSRKFLQFAEVFLSRGKSDKLHNKTVSFNNCMLRIPGSYNSKNGAQVTIVQLWDRQYKPEINYLLSDFCIYLANQKSAELKRRSHSMKKRKPRSRFPGNNNNNGIQWIEDLLLTPITDYRKLAIWRILVPYLLNIRGLSSEDVYNIICKWLDECNQLKRLDFSPNYRVKTELNRCKGFLPISSGKLMQEYPELYDLIFSNKSKN